MSAARIVPSFFNSADQEMRFDSNGDLNINDGFVIVSFSSIDDLALFAEFISSELDRREMAEADNGEAP